MLKTFFLILKTCYNPSLVRRQCLLFALYLLQNEHKHIETVHLLNKPYPIICSHSYPLRYWSILTCLFGQNFLYFERLVGTLLYHMYMLLTNILRLTIIIYCELFSICHYLWKCEEKTMWFTIVTGKERKYFGGY